MNVKRKSWWLAAGVLIIGLIGIWVYNVLSDSSSDITDAIPAPTPAATVSSEINMAGPSSGIGASSSPSPFVIPDITPQPIPSINPVLQPEKEVKNIEVPLTTPEKTSMPTEPPKPTAKTTDNPQTAASTPEYEAKDTEPNKKADEPKAGDKNSEGKIYVPGFGWIDDQGGGTQVIETGSDGDVDKQVGSMD